MRNSSCINGSWLGDLGTQSFVAGLGQESSSEALVSFHNDVLQVFVIPLFEEFPVPALESIHPILGFFFFVNEQGGTDGKVMENPVTNRLQSQRSPPTMGRVGVEPLFRLFVRLLAEDMNPIGADVL